MFCLQCRAEYVPGIEECADCGTALVHELPRRDEVRVEWVELLTLTSEPEAEMIRGFLESSGILCNLESLVFRAEPVAFGPLSKVRIHVPARDAARARELLDQVSDSDSSVTAVP